MAENEIGASETAQAAPVESEKLLKQSEVNELIGKIKHSERQKGHEEGYQKAISSMGGMKQEAPASQNVEDVVRSQFEKMRAEENAKAMEQNRTHQWNSMLGQLKPKVDEAAKKYADYDEVTSQVNFIKDVPEILAYANTVDNGGDVLYDLAKNPLKISQITGARSPQLAALAIKQISDSIKANEQAQAGMTKTREPISQIKPSPVGTGQGQMSIKDYKAKYRR